MRKLLKAIRDRRKRTMELKDQLKKELRAGDWRVRRTAVLLHAYELAVKRYGQHSREADLSYRAFAESRDRVRQQRDVIGRYRKAVNQSAAKLASWRRKYRKEAGFGPEAVAWANRMVGKHEAGNNDAGWLRDMEDFLVHHGHALAWMIPGNPYCGFGCIWAYQHAGVFLPDNFVGTQNICPRGGDRIGMVKLIPVAPEHAKTGALVVFNFGSGGAKHVGLARGPARGGVMPTVEFNTSPGNGGSQANGGGCYRRRREVGLMLCVLNVEPV